MYIKITTYFIQIDDWFYWKSAPQSINHLHGQRGGGLIDLTKDGYCESCNEECPKEVQDMFAFLNLGKSLEVPNKD